MIFLKMNEKINENINIDLTKEKLNENFKIECENKNQKIENEIKTNNNEQENLNENNLKIDLKPNNSTILENENKYFPILIKKQELPQTSKIQEKYCSSVFIFENRIFVTGGGKYDSIGTSDDEIYELKINKNEKNENFEILKIEKKYVQNFIKIRSHKTVIFKNNIYFYGGWTLTSFIIRNYTNGFFKMNIKNEENKTLISVKQLNEKNNKKLPSISSHTMVVVNNKIVVYGGKTISIYTNYYSTVFSIEIENDEIIWKEEEFYKIDNNNKIVELNCLYNHSAVVWKDSMIVYGGIIYDKITKTENISNYLLIFEFQKDKNFYQVINKINYPFLYCHSCSIIGDRIFIFGGSLNLVKIIFFLNIFKINFFF
jgi:hypothetical protein